MKINRRSLVDQFEDLVKQEIVNHQKEIENTNTAIRQNTLRIQEIENSIESTKAQMCSKQEHIYRLTEKLKQDYTEMRSILSSRMNDIEARIKELDKKMDAQIESAKMQKEVVETLYQSDNMIINSIKSLKAKVESMRYYFDQMIDNAKKYATYEAERVKKDIECIPDQVSPLKEDILTKFDELKVNREEILREIRVYKKQIFVQEKEIEDLYSRLEKLARG